MKFILGILLIIQIFATTVLAQSLNMKVLKPELILNYKAQEIGMSPVQVQEVINSQKTETTKNETELSFQPLDEAEYNKTYLNYNLSDASVLRMGGLEINQNTVSFFPGALPQIYDSIGEILTADEKSQWVLLVDWSEAIGKVDVLEVVSQSGKTLWQTELTETLKTNWQSQKHQWEMRLREKNLKVDSAHLLFASKVGFTFSEALFKTEDENFRFCLQSKTGVNRICSGLYYWRENLTDGKLTERKFFRNEALAEARVMINNKPSPLSDNLEVQANQDIYFFAELGNGMRYEFQTSKPNWILRDIYQTSDGNYFIVRISNSIPVLNFWQPQKESGWIQTLGFGESIKTKVSEWYTLTTKGNREIYLHGQNGYGVFTVPFLGTFYPNESHRLKVDGKFLNTTYRDEVAVGLKIPDTVKILTQDQYHDSRFYISTPSKFDWNEGSLIVESDTKKFKTKLEIYRALNRDISGRFTGVLWNNNFLFLGELSYNHWFEDIFDQHDLLWSYQRWGIGVKAFNTLGTITLKENEAKRKFASFLLDVKYRWTPGLWGKDESMGWLLSKQDLTYGEISTSLLGPGWFWARSMPVVFDQIMNLIPFLRYPKWVDMELVYYFGTDNKTQVQGAYAANFHGHIMWTNTIFGEAGFGIKTYNLETDKNIAAFAAYYATAGLGFKF